MILFWAGKESFILQFQSSKSNFRTMHVITSYEWIEQITKIERRKLNLRCCHVTLKYLQTIEISKKIILPTKWRIFESTHYTVLLHQFMKENKNTQHAFRLIDFTPVPCFKTHKSKP